MRIGALEMIMKAFSHAPCIQLGILLCMSELRLFYIKCTASDLSLWFPIPAHANNRQRPEARPLANPSMATLALYRGPRSPRRHSILPVLPRTIGRTPGKPRTRLSTDYTEGKDRNIVADILQCASEEINARISYRWLRIRGIPCGARAKRLRP